MNKIPFKSATKAARIVRAHEADGPIVDTGSIGDLKYDVYQRGSIHIFNQEKTLFFKKGCDSFEDALKELDLNNMAENQVKVIKGSGDNDNLVFTCKDGDITLSLEKRSYPMVDHLRSLLKKGQIAS